MSRDATIIIFDKYHGIRRMMLNCLYTLTDNILYSDNEDALRSIAKKHTVDLFVFNVYPDSPEAYLICRNLRFKSGTPAIFITPKQEPILKINAYKCGGDVVFSEDCDEDEFLAASERIIQKQQISPLREPVRGSLGCGRLIVNTESLSALVDGISADLTTKEALILLFLMKRANQIVPGREIYESIWEDEYNPDSCVLRTHICNLKNKIGTDSTDDYDIVAVRGAGYSFVTT